MTEITLQGDTRHTENVKGDAEEKKLVIELVNSTGLVAIDLGSLAVGGAMPRSAPLYPGSISTLSAEFGKTGVTPSPGVVESGAGCLGLKVSGRTPQNLLTNILQPNQDSESNPVYGGLYS